MKNCLIFDLDGTLASTVPLIFETWQYIFEKYENRKYSQSDLIGIFGTNDEEKALMKFFPDRVEEAKADWLEYYTENHNKALLFPGIENLLIRLKNWKIPMGICTNKCSQTTEITVKAFGLDRFFPVIISASEVPSGKPRPDGIFKICKYHDVPPNRAWMIGDNRSDLLAARNSGALGISALWGALDVGRSLSAGADVVCRTVNDFRIFCEINLNGYKTVSHY